ncbi:MAG: carbohydrate ABC transporter permease [Planctomycetota bacterium]
MPGRPARTATVVRMIVALVLASPLLWAAWASLQPIDRIFTAPGAEDAVRGPCSSLQWGNYREAVTRLPFLRFLLNACVITVAACVGTVFSSSLVGFAFARLRWRGRGAWFVVLLATMMLPAQVLLIPQFLVFEHLGWVNTYKPLIVPSWLGGSAFFIFLFRQFFKSVPQAYEDAARLDGVTDWQLYRHVMLPLSKPVVGAVAALSAVYHWQEFLAPLVYLSDFHTYPVSVGLRMFQAMEGSWANLIMAASLIALLPPLVVIVLTQRYLMRNIGAAPPA